MSPVSWGDIFTLLLRGDRIMELRHLLQFTKGWHYKLCAMPLGRNQRTALSRGIDPLFSWSQRRVDHRQVQQTELGPWSPSCKCRSCWSGIPAVNLTICLISLGRVFLLRAANQCEAVVRGVMDILQGKDEKGTTHNLTHNSFAIVPAPTLQCS